MVSQLPHCLGIEVNITVEGSGGREAQRKRKPGARDKIVPPKALMIAPASNN